MTTTLRARRARRSRPKFVCGVRRRPARIGRARTCIASSMATCRCAFSISICLATWEGRRRRSFGMALPPQPSRRCQPFSAGGTGARLARLGSWPALRGGIRFRRARASKRSADASVR